MTYWSVVKFRKELKNEEKSFFFPTIEITYSDLDEIFIVQDRQCIVDVLRDYIIIKFRKKD